MPGAGGMCLHTILLDPTHPGRITIAISAAGAFRSDDHGATWTAGEQGPRSAQIPDPTAEVGHCVHRIAAHPSRPDTLYMQKHWDVMRSDDGGDKLARGQRQPAEDFGFPIAVHAHEPETIYVVPIKSDSLALPAGRQAARLSQQEGRQQVGGADERPAAEALLRQRAARRHGGRLRSTPCGVYFGTTGGQVYASADAGDTWQRSPRPAGRALRRGADALHDPWSCPRRCRRSRTSTPRRSKLDVASPVTQRAVLDALEARYPMLRGTTRDRRTKKRRAYVRFFACKEDWPNASPDDPLPDLVASGEEPFLVIGAMSGG